MNSVRIRLRKPALLSTISFLIFIMLLCNLPAFLAAGELKVSLEGETLSVTAEKVPLQVILLKLARDGVIVRIDPQINPLITTNFKNRPVDQALETIFKPASYSLLWEARSDSAGNNAIQLAEIQVFKSERKHLMKPLVPKRTLNITKNSEGVFYVENEIILYLPLGVNLQKLEKLIKAFDATLFYSILPGPAKILLPSNSDVFAIAREIKNKININISQPNYAYPLESPVVHLTGSNQISIDPDLYVPTDNNIPIAILDSGLAENAELEKFVVSSFDVMNPEASITDTLGHGTQMAYIASGIVKPYGSVAGDMSYMPIIPIRAFDDNGYTTDFNIMISINFALANNAKVMSLSWGSETRSDFMEKAFEYANAQGLVIVASAGNNPTGNPVYPAAYPSVIGVGALGPHGKTWENSNYGNFVTLYAPGFADLPVGYKGEPGMYAGTSISAALIANSIGSYLSENPAATLQEIREYLDKKY
jgi:hypothetical protein